MARDFNRTDRIADQIQKDLARLIQFEIKDPRMGMVTISHVRVAKDLGVADIYITVLPLGEQEQEQAIKDALSILNNASGFLRGELARQINLRVLPSLRFHFDSTIERGRHLTSLIEKASRLEDEKPQDDQG